MTIVFMFPGQSSRSADMLDRIVAAWAPAASLIDHASRVLGRDVRAHYAQPCARAFANNQDIQVGVFLTSYLHQQALAAYGITGDRSLGLSLGEYNHLVHIGALSFEEALRLVAARGRVYDQGPAGMMASVFPLPIEELQPFVDDARATGFIEIANRNSPSQNVIAGECTAVERAAMRIEDERPGVQVTVIERQIPMHTSMFREVGPALRPYLDRTAWRVPVGPYLPNVTAAAIDAPGPDRIATLLERHASEPVLWRDSIDAIAARHPDACFVEVGPGAVLFNLLQKRWHDNRKLRTDDLHDPAGQLSRVLLEFGVAA